VVARISAVPSFDEVNTNDASAGSSGESSTERRFVVSGTELGQEAIAPYDEYLLLPESVENSSPTPSTPDH
jgi:hypothetical protein